MYVFSILLAFLLCALFAQVNAQPEGWRMVDRFFGFRYELFPAENVEPASFLTKIQTEADAYACFGWVQHSTLRGSVVGEARCSKARGPVFLDKLKTFADVNRAEILIYEDTKIRLHFSHFKVLPEERETCFLDAPHQCKDFQRDSTATSASAHRSDKEL